MGLVIWWSVSLRFVNGGTYAVGTIKVSNYCFLDRVCIWAKIYSLNKRIVLDRNNKTFVVQG